MPPTGNLTGWKTANREELTWFINTDIWMREEFALNHHRVSGDRVTWDEAAAESFYQNIGVAPVQFVFEATIRSGKIKSIIAQLPTGEIDSPERPADHRPRPRRVRRRPAHNLIPKRPITPVPHL
jgi:hypothetical protein